MLNYNDSGPPEQLTIPSRGERVRGYHARYPARIAVNGFQALINRARLRRDLFRHPSKTHCPEYGQNGSARVDRQTVKNWVGIGFRPPSQCDLIKFGAADQALAREIVSGLMRKAGARPVARDNACISCPIRRGRARCGRPCPSSRNSLDRAASRRRPWPAARNRSQQDAR